MKDSLRIAVASGKGGTGKTTIATGLAAALSRAGLSATYIDCDVEAPNGHLFLRPTIDEIREVSIPVPQIDDARCTRCGACETACRHSAIVTLPNQVLTFPARCHGCGGCRIACPEDAISEVLRVIGVVESGIAGPLRFVQGRLHIGEAMAPPVIRTVAKTPSADGTLVIDAPPGTSCPVIAAVNTADVVLLVTEPTPFGLNDLKLAVEMTRALRIPFGVAINRAGMGNRDVFEYCQTRGLSVLIEIPDDRRIAAAGSEGKLCITALPDLESMFVSLHQQLGMLSQTVPLLKMSNAAADVSEPAVSLALPSERIAADSKRDPLELVVISGKGGTGKTSIVAAFAVLSKSVAMADCDVDAANLHLILNPTVQERRGFSGGYTAVIQAERCTACQECVRRCRFGAIRTTMDSSGVICGIDEIACEGCGVCVDVCPVHAVVLQASQNGEWFVSGTRYGPMVHARLGTAQENSGKLVTLVRRECGAVARIESRRIVISDGSPGIGCPVIASISGAHLVLVVTEPTLSGLHDLCRVAELCSQLGVSAGICINRADINPTIADDIIAEAARRKMRFFGSVRSDDAVTAAQLQRQSVVEYGDSPAARDIRVLWSQIQRALLENGKDMT